MKHLLALALILSTQASPARAEVGDPLRGCAAEIALFTFGVMKDTHRPKTERALNALYLYISQVCVRDRGLAARDGLSEDATQKILVEAIAFADGLVFEKSKSDQR